MAKIDLSKYGITGTTEIVYNPSYEVLFEEETRSELTGYEKGQVSELGAVNVMTGIYTGRSPKDKFIVMDENSKDTVWWTSDEYKNDNHPATQEAWKSVKELAIKELSNKKLYVVDAFCGANKDTRMAIRFIVEVAWQAHFVTNMFIKPTAEELENFEPDFVVYNASKAKVENYKELGLNSETAVMFNITSREQVIVNTWYGGEMKKGMFSMMNYYLPLKGIASMHCSANTDLNGENTAIFFGLSGTGKTTLLNMLSAYVPSNELIITIEDTCELKLQQPNVRRMEVRSSTSSDMLTVDQKILVRNALRQRPDRIILGETRDGSIVDLISAMSSGHDGSISTIHANDPENMCNVRIPILYSMNKDVNFSEKSIAMQISEAIQVIVQIKRFPDGSRKISQISCVEGLDENDKVKVVDIFRYDKNKKDFIATGYVPRSIIEKIRSQNIPFQESIFEVKRGEENA